MVVATPCHNLAPCRRKELELEKSHIRPNAVEEMWRVLPARLELHGEDDYCVNSFYSPWNTFREQAGMGADTARDDHRPSAAATTTGE